MLESKIENYFQQQINKCGGITFKFKSPTMRGVPDQIVLYDGNTYFVEMKAPGEKPRPSQKAVHRIFESQDIPVYTLDTIESVDHFIFDELDAEIIEELPETFELKKNMFKM